VVYDEARPAIGARAIGLQIADAVAEVLAPTGDGWLRNELMRTGQGILSNVFRVRDLDQARRSGLGAEHRCHEVGTEEAAAKLVQRASYLGLARTPVAAGCERTEIEPPATIPTRNGVDVDIEAGGQRIAQHDRPRIGYGNAAFEIAEGIPVVALVRRDLESFGRGIATHAFGQ
jgi:hypothetical protein